MIKSPTWAFVQYDRADDRDQINHGGDKPGDRADVDIVHWFFAAAFRLRPVLLVFFLLRSLH